MRFKTKLSLFLIATVMLTGCSSTQDTKQIELYTSKLEPLMGKSTEEVIPMATNQWEFKLQSRWAGANPSAEMVLKRNHRRAPFSKQEANEIFKEKGYYDVLVLAKKGSEGAAIESHTCTDIDIGTGPGYHQHVHEYAYYVFVRFVFREKKLHNFRCFHVQIAN